MRSPLIDISIALTFLVGSAATYTGWFAIVSAKSTTVADLESQITTKNNTMDRITSARESLAQIANDEATIQNYFVPETGVVDFITALETYGKTQKATLDVLSVAKTGTSVRPTLTLSLTVNGSFDAVMRTIGSIEYAPYDLTVTTLSLGVTKEAWNALFTIVVGSVPLTAATTTQP